MWSKRPPSPEARAPRAPAPRVAQRLARISARISLAISRGLVLAGLLPGVSCAMAEEQHVSLQPLASPESGPQVSAEGGYAVPGERTQLGFLISCSTSSPTGWCDGGFVVAHFGANDGYKVVEAWTGRGAQCQLNDWYFACPIDIAGNGAVQEVYYVLEVAPSNYSDCSVIAVGTDGLRLPPAEFIVRMRGKGALRISNPKDMVISEAGGLTYLHFSTEGPSMNRGVRFSFGPFPRHMDPRLLGPDLPCELSAQRILSCGPVDKMPGSHGTLILSVQRVPPLPPLPSYELIHVLATSDLTPCTPSEFMTTIPAPPTR